MGFFYFENAEEGEEGASWPKNVPEEILSDFF